MEKQKTATLFNDYINRVKDNIADCKILSLSIKISDNQYAYAIIDGNILTDKDIKIAEQNTQGEDKIAQMHGQIYKNIKTADAIIQANAINAKAVGSVGVKIPALLDDMAQIIGVDAKCSKDNINNIIKNLKKRKGTIIKDNGLITYGRTLDEAYTGCLVLEKGAKCLIDATVLGKYRKIPYFEAVLMHFIYQKKYSKANQKLLKDRFTEKNTYNSEIKSDISQKELELRQSVVEAGKRLLQKNLVQGTWGNISIRIDDQNMLITPSGLDYMSLKPEDMVKMNYYTMDYLGNLKPSGEKDIHATLMRERKDISVIMHSHPPECSAFAAADYALPAINEEMQRYVKGEARVAAYALPSTKSLAKTTVIAMEGRNACFMANHGMLAVGKDIEEAFECCRVLEDCAKTYIDNLAKEEGVSNRISFFKKKMDKIN